MKKSIIAILLVLVGVGAGVALSSYSARAVATHSVEMSVSRMSCGSCVETIRGAVTALNGTTTVQTDVNAARSYVEFRADEIDAEKIAQTITASGYPATILYVRDSSGEVLSGIDAEKYVARIGSRLIERASFSQMLSARMYAAETSGKPVPFKAACQDAWRSLLKQELLLNAADQFGIAVSDADLEKKLAETPDADRSQLVNEMKIDGYLAMQYQDREPDVMELNNLLNFLNSKTAVDIFDDKLKQQLSTGKSGSGCGGSCC